MLGGRGQNKYSAIFSMVCSWICRYDAELDTRFSSWRFEKELDAGGLAVVPGLVDAHTHPVWEGDRVNEFALKVMRRRERERICCEGKRESERLNLQRKYKTIIYLFCVRGGKLTSPPASWCHIYGHPLKGRRHSFHCQLCSSGKHRATCLILFLTSVSHDARWDNNNGGQEWVRSRPGE